MAKKMTAAKGKVVQVKAHTRNLTPRTAAKAANQVVAVKSELPAAYEAVTEVVAVPMTPPPAPPAAAAVTAPVPVAPLAILTLAAAACVVGAYVVLYGVLEPLYHGAGAALRALVPLAVEMIMGYAAHELLGARRTLLAVLSVLVILGCGWTEIDAAAAAPSVAARERAAQVLEHAAQPAPAVKLQDIDAGEGRQAKLAHEQNAGKQLELAAQDRADAREIRKQQLAIAQATTAGEGRLPIELAILGAIGSSCLLPLLQALLAARGRK